MSNMFEESLSGYASPKVMAVTKAAIAVLEGQQLSTVCNGYGVTEKDVIKFIVEKTEYETIFDLQRQKEWEAKQSEEDFRIWAEAQDNPDITITKVKGGAIYERRK